MNVFISHVSENRGIRDGEVHGVTYYYVPREEMVRMKADGELFNYNERGEVIYGLSNKELAKAKTMLVLVGPSGSGKDTVLMGLESAGIDGLMSIDDTDHIGTVILDHDGANEALAKAPALGLDLVIVWLNIDEATRAERVLARDGSDDRVKNCWVKRPNRVDFETSCKPGVAEEIMEFINSRRFIPDPTKDNLVQTVRAPLISAAYDGMVFNTFEEAKQIAKEMLAISHSSNGMMLDEGTQYFLPDPYSIQEGCTSTFFWSGDEFDVLFRDRGIICKTEDEAYDRAQKMLALVGKTCEKDQ